MQTEAEKGDGEQMVELVWPAIIVAGGLGVSFLVGLLFDIGLAVAAGMLTSGVLCFSRGAFCRNAIH